MENVMNEETQATVTDEEREETLAEESSERDDDGMDALISLGIGLGALVFLSGAQQYAGVRTGSSDPGAAFWPQIVLLVVLASSVLNLALIYRRNEENVVVDTLTELVSGVGRAGNAFGASEGTRTYVLSILLTAGYLTILSDVGFLVATTAFFASFVWTLGYRNPVKLAVVSLVTSAFVFGLFRGAMNIALPYGTGFFREFSIFVEGLL